MLKQQVVRISAERRKGGASGTLSQARYLLRELYLCQGCRVMLSDNVWVEASLCNGAQGYVVGAIFNQDQPPPALPVAVIVQFDGYTGPSIHPHLPRCAPILPLEAVWGSGKSRLQIPLRPSYAMTIHKSQGQTLDSCVVQLGEDETSPGLTFVALSRVRKLSDLIVEPMPFSRLGAIARSAGLRERVTEEGRLYKLAFQ
eukprot:TRINITY_DN1395_c0_g1_i1.p1 TRINITY_DN1395_c0_g1~~TRINITY_DN1395_c0_g1_i1.p1  ORF type:complete len:200 (+),score=33.58 TRINITY_DN1395_c0_g1_i1:677-1276(+)